MNNDVQRFLNINGIDPMELSQNINGRLQAPSEINDIVTKYSFHKPYEARNISVADIIGYDYEWSYINPYIAYSMDAFFDSRGDGYHSRSVGLLDYTAYDVVDRIDFEYERMVVDDMGDNKYVISTNGLHRYTVLRILYLSEYIKARGNKEEIERLKEKYTIPVKFGELDIIKTYSKYLLMSSNCGVKDIEKEYDRENWTYTGRLIIIKENNEQIIIKNDDELLRYVKSQAKSINQNIENLQKAYNSYPSFREFSEKYCGDILDIAKLKERFNDYNRQEEGVLK